MKLPPFISALLACTLVCMPLVTGAQSGFGLFSRDPEAMILRKAKRYNLVSIKDVVPGAYIDMRYKVTSASGKPLYLPSMPCLAHRSTAEKLKQVNREMNAHGYAIKIWDAWRPPEAHQALWDAVQDPDYVVPPSKGLSWHCYGISIDLTLVKKDGTPVEMPSRFDEFSTRAASNYQGGDPEIARRVDLLQKSMTNAGFRTIKSEWWHFDDMTARGGIRRVTAKDLGIEMPKVP
ncbi:MAG: M15 family metallopeptidase [Verrucomicrobiales bacterium]|nr:M15 family metallopeptidase [Verrucomicrobiales bacterium]